MDKMLTRGTKFKQKMGNLYHTGSSLVIKQSLQEQRSLKYLHPNMECL